MQIVLNTQTPRKTKLKNNLISFWLLSLFFCFSITLNGQRFIYDVYDTKDGITSPIIMNVFQDSRGYIWTGTKLGISRFNGVEFENFPFWDRGILSRLDFQIAEDKDEDIWFKVNGQIAFFNYGTQKITQLKLSNEANEAISIDRISFDEIDKVWFLTSHGIFSLPFQMVQKLKKKTRLKVDLLKLEYFYEGFYSQVGSMLPDSKGGLFFFH